MAEDYFLYILDSAGADPHLILAFVYCILPLAYMVFSNFGNIADPAHYFVLDSYFDYSDIADFEALSLVLILALDIIFEKSEEILEGG